MMEILKAISILSSVATRNNYCYITEDEISEAFYLAEVALRKQVPLKPVPCAPDSTWSKCSVCGDTYIDEYCGKCGQKLDWSEVGEIEYIKYKEYIMPDIINGLVQRRSKLIARRVQLEKEYQSELLQINNDIEVINQAISTIENSIHDLLCTNCKGTGEARRCDAAGQMESVPCPECKGTGVKID